MMADVGHVKACKTCKFGYFFKDFYIENLNIFKLVLFSLLIRQCRDKKKQKKGYQSFARKQNFSLICIVREIKIFRGEQDLHCKLCCKFSSEKVDTLLFANFLMFESFSASQYPLYSPVAFKINANPFH